MRVYKDKDGKRIVSGKGNIVLSTNEVAIHVQDPLNDVAFNDWYVYSINPKMFSSKVMFFNKIRATIRAIKLIWGT